MIDDCSGCDKWVKSAGGAAAGSLLAKIDIYYSLLHECSYAARWPLANWALSTGSPSVAIDITYGTLSNTTLNTFELANTNIKSNGYKKHNDFHIFFCGYAKNAAIHPTRQHVRPTAEPLVINFLNDCVN